MYIGISSLEINCLMLYSTKKVSWKHYIFRRMVWERCLMIFHICHIIIKYKFQIFLINHIAPPDLEFTSRTHVSSGTSSVAGGAVLHSWRTRIDGPRLWSVYRNKLRRRVSYKKQCISSAGITCFGDIAVRLVGGSVVRGSSETSQPNVNSSITQTNCWTS